MGSWPAALVLVHLDSLNLDPDTVHTRIPFVLAERCNRSKTVYSHRARVVLSQELFFQPVPPKLLQQRETSLVWDQHLAVAMLAREDLG